MSLPPQPYPHLSLVAAVAENRVIGRDNGLPWRLREDLRHFRDLTLGHPVIMGRKTYESLLTALGKPLPGRTSILLTRRTDYHAPGCRVVTSIGQALEAAREAPGGEEALVIGGGEVYRMTLPLAQRLYLTEIHQAFEGDAWFPDLPKGEWRETAREPREEGGLAYDFVTYQRRPSPK